MGDRMILYTVCRWEVIWSRGNIRTCFLVCMLWWLWRQREGLVGVVEEFVCWFVRCLFVGGLRFGSALFYPINREYSRLGAHILYPVLDTLLLTPLVTLSHSHTHLHYFLAINSLIRTHSYAVSLSALVLFMNCPLPIVAMCAACNKTTLKNEQVLANKTV